MMRNNKQSRNLELKSNSATFPKKYESTYYSGEKKKMITIVNDFSVSNMDVSQDQSSK